MKKIAVCILATLLACVVMAKPKVGAHIAIGDLPQHWISGTAPVAWTPGELYVLEFWATWCGPCQKAMPHVEEMWQAVKGKGIHFIGVNIDKNRSAADIKQHLNRLPVKPTYAMVLQRGEGLAEKLDIKGIPNTAIIRDGVVIWAGHPAKLTLETLWELKGGKPPQKVNSRPVANRHASVPLREVTPYETMHEIEARADACAQVGEWRTAVQLQQQALLAHPLQRQLPTPYLPVVNARTSSRVSSSEAQKTLSITTYWKYPSWIKELTQNDAILLPGAREAVTFTAPYTLTTLVASCQKNETEALRIALHGFDTEIKYIETIDEAAFNVNERYKYPFIQIRMGEELLYAGALEAMPTVFRGPLLTADAYQSAIAEEKARAKISKEAFLALRNGNPTLAWETTLTPGYASLAIPYFFGEAYRANDITKGKELVSALTLRYKEQPGVLETLIKLIDVWQELSLATSVEQELLFVILAENNPRQSSAYAVEYYLRAADCTKAQQTPEAETRRFDYIRNALLHTVEVERLQRFRCNLPALPATPK